MPHNLRLLTAAAIGGGLVAIGVLIGVAVSRQPSDEPGRSAEVPAVQSPSRSSGPAPSVPRRPEQTPPPQSPNTLPRASPPSQPLPSLSVPNLQLKSLPALPPRLPELERIPLPRIPRIPELERPKDMPRVKVPTPRSLPHGTIVCPDAGPQGQGQLTVQNGNDRDALVTLVEPDNAGKRTRVCAYVRARQNLTLPGIGTGVYRVRFQLGIDWGGERFVEKRESFEFVDSIDFSERSTKTAEGEQLEFKSWTFTLHPVMGGHARTARIADQSLLPADVPPSYASSAD